MIEISCNRLLAAPEAPTRSCQRLCNPLKRPRLIVEEARDYTSCQATTSHTPFLVFAAAVAGGSLADLELQNILNQQVRNFHYTTLGDGRHSGN